MILIGLVGLALTGFNAFGEVSGFVMGESGTNFVVLTSAGGWVANGDSQMITALQSISAGSSAPQIVALGATTTNWAIVYGTNGYAARGDNQMLDAFSSINSQRLPIKSVSLGGTINEWAITYGTSGWTARVSDSQLTSQLNAISAAGGAISNIVLTDSTTTWFVRYGSTGWYARGPTQFIDDLNAVSGAGKTINGVTLARNGQSWIIFYGNGGYRSFAPSAMNAQLASVQTQGVTGAAIGSSDDTYVILYGTGGYLVHGPQVLLDALQQASGAAPHITSEPQNQAAAAGQTVSLSVSATGATTPAFQWRLNGAAIGGATGSTYSVSNLQPAKAGLYTALITTPAGNLTSDPAIVGVTTTSKVIGAGEEIAHGVYVAANGNTFDQVLLNGAAATVTAEAGKITRTSFVDLTNDIVQVEFSGAGALSLVLDNPSGPALPANYNQSILYMKGHVGIVITGADETTNVSVFSVGRITAVNQALFKDITYDGLADLSFIAISSSDGKFGGIRAANASFYASSGLTGIWAPGVQFTGPVYVGDIDAFDLATSALVLGSASDVRITGGDLQQANGRAVVVNGISHLTFSDGSTSHGQILPAKTNAAQLQQNGTDVSTALTASSFSLTTSTAGTGQGTISRSPSATSYAPGTVVTLTAAAGSGSTFSGWGGAASGSGASVAVTMTDNLSVTATFTSNPGGGGGGGGGASSNLRVVPGNGFYGSYDPYGKGSVVDGGTLMADGGTPFSGYTWTVTTGSTLPPGVALQPFGLITYNGGTVIPGNYVFNVTVSDGSRTATGNVSFTADTESTAPDSNGISSPQGVSVFSQLNLASYTLISGQVGSAYAATVFVSLGSAGNKLGTTTPLPLSWAAVNSATSKLPPGLTLDSARGVVRGTPTTAGIYRFKIVVQDANGNATVSGSPDYVITIN